VAQKIDIRDRPAQEDMSRCVHCGFCLQQCPTYLQLGLETDSPRGRIHLIQAITDGAIESTPSLTKHLDLCLQCRACETACPSGVEFGRIMESGRAMIVQQGKAPRSWRLRSTLLKLVLPYPKRIALLFHFLRLYQRTGLQKLVRASGLLRILPGNLAEAERQLPPLPRPFDMSTSGPKADTPTKRVALLTGCVMPHIYARTHEATVSVLARHNVEVVDVPQQRCCGALSLHAGDRVTGRDLARRNIDAFLATDVDAIVINSAGCGASLKEYAELLAEDAAYADKARTFSAKVKDVLEFLAEAGIQPPRSSIDLKVTYQDSCHLVHGQEVRTAPRDLLRAIPGLDLVELQTPDRCCGSAGIYSFAQQEMSRRLLDAKMEDVAATGASVIATANPGCMMQLEAGLRRHKLTGRIVHVVELLDEAYSAGDRG
jgi:glycolate oxidase iron-sulfur subunit